MQIHFIDMWRFKLVALCALKMLFILLDSTVSDDLGCVCDQLQQKTISMLTSYNLCIATLIMKFR